MADAAGGARRPPLQHRDMSAHAAAVLCVSLAIALAFYPADDGHLCASLHKEASEDVAAVLRLSFDTLRRDTSSMANALAWVWSVTNVSAVASVIQAQSAACEHVLWAPVVLPSALDAFEQGVRANGGKHATYKVRSQSTATHAFPVLLSIAGMGSGSSEVELGEDLITLGAMRGNVSLHALERDWTSVLPLGGLDLPTLLVPVRETVCSGPSCVQEVRGVVACGIDVRRHFDAVRSAFVFDDVLDIAVGLQGPSGLRVLYGDSSVAAQALLPCADGSARSCVEDHRLTQRVAMGNELFVVSVSMASVAAKHTPTGSRVPQVALCVGATLLGWVVATWLLARRQQELRAQLDGARYAVDGERKISLAMVGYLRHEVKNILNGLAGHLELSVDDSPVAAKPLDANACDVRAAQRLCGLLRTVVDDVINVRHFIFENSEGVRMACGDSTFTLADIEDILRDVASARTGSELRGVRVSYRRSTRLTLDGIHVHPSSGKVSLVGDKAHLQLALSSALLNAVQATPEGGHVSARLAVECEAVGAHFEGVVRGSLTCTIVDNGAEISQDAMPHLFSPFAQVPLGDGAAAGGRAVGLSLCSFLVNQLGGEVSCTRRVDGREGNELRVRMPIGVRYSGGAHTVDQGQRTREGELPWETTPSVTGSPVRPRHLVCDDGAINRSVLRRILERTVGAEVDEASNGCEAVALVAAEGPVYDAIWMDVHMPTMDGIEATRRLRAMAQAEGIPIIGVTASIGALPFAALNHSPATDSTTTAPTGKAPTTNSSSTAATTTHSGGTGAPCDSPQPLAGAYECVTGKDLLDAGMDDVLCKPISQRAVRKVCEQLPLSRRSIGASDMTPTASRRTVLAATSSSRQRV